MHIILEVFHSGSLTTFTTGGGARFAKDAATQDAKLALAEKQLREAEDAGASAHAAAKDRANVAHKAVKAAKALFQKETKVQRGGPAGAAGRTRLQSATESIPPEPPHH